MFLSFLLFTLMSQAQQPEIRLQVPKTPTNQESRAWTLNATTEFRTFNERRSGRLQPRKRDGLFELSAAAEFRFDKTLSVLSEIAIEQLSPERSAEFYVQQAYLSWNPHSRLRIAAGQQFVPVGIILPQDNLFSSLPPFYEDLLGGNKAIDIGARANLSLLPYLNLEAGYFLGQLVRSGDERTNSADRPPTIFSVKSESSFHRVFVSRYDHQLDGFDPVTAWGAGGEIVTPQWKGFKFSGTLETWQINQRQRLGPDQSTAAYLWLGQLEWNTVAAGYRYSRAEREVGALNLPAETSRLQYLQWRFLPIAVARLESAFDQSSRVLRDEWVGRLIVNYSY